MTGRLAGIAVAALGVVIGALPFAGWYRVDLAQRDIVLRGVDVHGELWSLLVLGAVVAAIGIVAAVVDPRGRAARWSALGCAVAGAAALVWALWSALRITSVAVPMDPGDGPVAPIVARPVSLLAAAAAAAVAALSLWWARAHTD